MFRYTNGVTEMTSSEARKRVGQLVTERKVCDDGTLVSVAATAGGGGRRSEYLCRIQYEGCLRLIPLSALLATTNRPNCSRAKRLDAAKLSEFLKLMRSLFFSGPKVMEDFSPKDFDRQDSASSAVFAHVFGRNPSAAELEYMIGGMDGDRCERCGQYRKPDFHGDGKFGWECKCTDELNKSFGVMIKT